MAAISVTGFAAFSPSAAEPLGTGAMAGGIAALAFSDSASPNAINRPLGSQTRRWEQTVRRHFDEEDVTRALAVISCESSGDPLATNEKSGAAGLFQHLPRFWLERSARAGLGTADVYDPEDNVAVAAWLVYEGGGWHHWYPSASCWSTAG